MIRKSLRRPLPKLWQRINSFRTLKQIHSYMLVHGFNSDPSHLRELIYAAAVTVSGSINYAHQLFEQISQPDVFTWNAIIRGSAQSLDPSKAISLYTQMEEKRNKPDKFTFSFLLKACTKLSWVSMGAQLHAKAAKYGFDAESFVRNSLINLHANCGDLNVASRLFQEAPTREVVAWSALMAGYARRGDLELARKLFDEMPVKDLVSWNVMISVYAKKGQMEKAQELFDLLPERDVVSWNAVLAGYVLRGSYSQALELFGEMQRTGEPADEVTFLSLLSACADSGDLETGKRIHCLLTEKNPNDLSILLSNALIDMYSKCGNIENATEVFRKMKERDVATWNSIILGSALHGHGSKSINLFIEMTRQKLRPNEVTFVGVLVGCSHAGMVQQGHHYFNLMRERYGIEPNIKHYGCMVDMLGRAGQLKEAFDFIEDMRIKPNTIIWRALLGACRLHGNLELAEKANKRILEMHPDQSGDFVLLSNAYASMDEWVGAEKVRKLMDDRGVRKEAGLSLIEADNKELMHFLLGRDSNLKLRDYFIQPK
ncbi:pentatricopeptide repeat-containing protein At5g15300 [Aristolochia californica]|uniref:pentatricopeptide repeat-containing protein At5g15300 n=1 Tax=Aristolochia californica TaxID=171875 RepID=UPI0035E05824